MVKYEHWSASILGHGSKGIISLKKVQKNLRQRLHHHSISNRKAKKHQWYQVFPDNSLIHVGCRKFQSIVATFDRLPGTTDSILILRPLDWSEQIINVLLSCDLCQRLTLGKVGGIVEGATFGEPWRYFSFFSSCFFSSPTHHHQQVLRKWKKMWILLLYSFLEISCFSDPVFSMMCFLWFN